MNEPLAQMGARSTLSMTLCNGVAFDYLEFQNQTNFQVIRRGDFINRGSLLVQGIFKLLGTPLARVGHVSLRDLFDGGGTVCQSLISVCSYHPLPLTLADTLSSSTQYLTAPTDTDTGQRIFYWFFLFPDASTIVSIPHSAARYIMSSFNARIILPYRTWSALCVKLQ